MGITQPTISSHKAERDFRLANLDCYKSVEGGLVELPQKVHDV